MNTCVHACFFAYHIQVPPYCSPLPQCGGNLLNQGQLSGNDRFLLSAGTVNKSDTMILCFLPFPFHTETLSGSNILAVIRVNSYLFHSFVQKS